MSMYKSPLSQSHFGSPSSTNLSPRVHQQAEHYQQNSNIGGGGPTPQSSSSHGGTFLPNYLLGGGASSPTLSGSFHHGGKATSTSSGAGGYQRMSPPHQTFHSFSSSQDKRNQSQHRVSPLLHGSLGQRSSNGPPVQGLYDNERISVDEISSTNGWTATPPKPMLSFSGQNQKTPGNTSQLDNSMNSSVFSTRPDLTLQSPAQLDPFYTQGESLGSTDTLDETWVTIFGFPPSLVAYILEQFSQYGTMEQKKALSKNGKILNGNVMIGVCQCIDKSLMNQSQQDVSCYKSILGTPSTNSAVKSPITKPSSIRPLTAAYQAAANENKVIQDGNGTPQRNNSIVSKTLEYVFGW
eukprot:gene16754-18448_t